MKHVCMGCGVVCECKYGSWFDRHPVATVAMLTLTGLPLSMFLLTMAIHQPLAGVAIAAVGTLSACGFFADREYKRRMALRARADWQNWLLSYRG